MRNIKFKFFFMPKKNSLKSEDYSSGINGKQFKDNIFTGSERNLIPFIFPVLFLCLFVVGLTLFSVVIVPANSNADSGIINLGVDDVLSIALDAEDVSLSLTPSESGTFGMNSTTVKVYTNAAGYKLYLTNKDNDNSLKHEASQTHGITDIFSSLPNTITIETNNPLSSTNAFPVNSWGYSIDKSPSKTFSAVPTAATILKDVPKILVDGNYTDISNGSDLPSDSASKKGNGNYKTKTETTVFFGAKADKTLASGHYSDSVIFDVATNAVGKDNDITGITYLQDITPARCSNTNPGTETILIDNRDGKEYFVSKLTDGNCWFTQNLDLDLFVATKDSNEKYIINSGTSGSTGYMGTKDKNGDFVSFTNENTDISGTNWTIPSGSAGYATQTNTGTAWDNYGRNGGNGSTYEIRSYDPQNTCLTSGVSNANCGTTIGSANHEHTGNYYNWPAATAGSGTYSKSSGNVLDSICPKGWKLPGGNTVSANNVVGWNSLLVDNYKISTNSDAGIRVAPHYLLRSGFYRYDSGLILNRSLDGFYWSSTTYDTNDAHTLYFYDSHVSPGIRNDYKGDGFSVRCYASSDTEAPTNISYNQTGYNTITVSATDVNSGLHANPYCVQISSDSNNCDWKAPGTTFTIGSAGTWYIFARDANGTPNVGRTTLRAYTVSLSTKRAQLDVYHRKTGTNDTLIMTRTSSDDTAVTGSFVVINNTQVYISATATNGSTLSSVSPSNKSTSIITANTTITAIGVLSNMTGATWLQSVTKKVCTNTKTGTIASGLKDRRDNKIYKVAKFSDGNCWMVQSLALNGGTTLNLNNTYSHIPSGTTYRLPASGTTFSSNTTAQMYNGSHRDNTKDAGLTNTGSFYNWPAVTAGQAPGVFAGFENTTRDICPSGWRLPKQYDGNSTYLAESLFIQSNPTLFELGCVFSNSTSCSNSYITPNPGWANWFWSSTSRDSYYAFLFASNSNTSIVGGTYGGRYLPGSVRCILAQ